MKITVNGEEKQIDDGMTVNGLLDNLKISPVGIAVEVNREIIPRTEHPETTLCEGDKLEIIRMVGGG